MAQCQMLMLPTVASPQGTGFGPDTNLNRHIGYCLAARQSTL